MRRTRITLHGVDCLRRLGAGADTGRTPAGGIRSGYGIFQTNCSGCHGNPEVQRAPDPNTLRQMSPEKIYEALTSSAMKVVGDKLSGSSKSEPWRRRSAGAIWGVWNRAMPRTWRIQLLPSNPALVDPARGAAWTGWGVDAGNSRFSKCEKQPG